MLGVHGLRLRSVGVLRLVFAPEKVKELGFEGVAKDVLRNPKNVLLADPLHICIRYYGTPRITQMKILQAST